MYRFNTQTHKIEILRLVGKVYISKRLVKLSAIFVAFVHFAHINMMRHVKKKRHQHFVEKVNGTENRNADSFIEFYFSI